MRIIVAVLIVGGGLVSAGMLDITPFSHGSNSDNAPASQESTFTLKS